MPLHHFQSRTSSAAFFISFMAMVISSWVVYIYPVFFQSVLDSPRRSGVHLLPFQIVFPVFAAVCGGVVSKTGRYKPVHLVATAAVAICTGFASLLTKTTHRAVWVVFQLLTASGLGCMISTTLQAVQAGLPESEVASSTASWSSIRSLGTIWGVSIPSAVFNNRFDQLSKQFDPSIRDSFTRGKAYEHATAAFVQAFDPDTRNVIVDAYINALKHVWLVSIAFGVITVLSVFLEKELALRTELDSDFRLDEKNKDKGEVKQTLE